MATRPYLRPPERRQQLLAAAGRVLARDGAAKITMRDIAAEAGITRQSLYTHFPNLESVIEAYAIDAFVTVLDAGGMGRDVLGTDPADEGVSMLEVTLELRPEQRELMRLVHARATIDGLERLTAMFETRLFARWRSYEPLSHLTDGTLRVLLWLLAGMVLTIAESVHRGDLDAADARRIVRALPDQVRTAFGEATS